MSAPAASPTSPTERLPLKASDLTNPRLYVGNLAFAVTKEDLEAELSSQGITAASISLLTYSSGRSKGCAIIEFSNTADAAKAANSLTNKELKGRTIYAREDREEKGFIEKKREERNAEAGSRPPREEGGRGGRGGEP
jgi:RNA recognition motif-containing protein